MKDSWSFFFSWQVSHKYSLIYIITKLGLLFVYDIETASAIYRTRISSDPIFLTTEASSVGGFYAITRRGQVLLVTVNEATIVPFISSQVNETIKLLSIHEVVPSVIMPSYINALCIFLSDSWIIWSLLKILLKEETYMVLKIWYLMNIFDKFAPKLLVLPLIFLCCRLSSVLGSFLIKQSTRKLLRLLLNLLKGFSGHLIQLPNSEYVFIFLLDLGRWGPAQHFSGSRVKQIWAPKFLKKRFLTKIK